MDNQRGLDVLNRTKERIKNIPEEEAEEMRKKFYEKYPFYNKCLCCYKPLDRSKDPLIIINDAHCICEDCVNKNENERVIEYFIDVIPDLNLELIKRYVTPNIYYYEIKQDYEFVTTTAEHTIAMLINIEGLVVDQRMKDPIKCNVCGYIIDTADNDYLKINDEYICEDCIHHDYLETIKTLAQELGLELKKVTSYNIYQNGNYIGNTESDSLLDIIEDINDPNVFYHTDIPWN